MLDVLSSEERHKLLELLNSFRGELIAYMLGAMGREPLKPEEKTDVVFKNMTITEPDLLSILGNEISKWTDTFPIKLIEKFKVTIIEILVEMKKEDILTVESTGSERGISRVKQMHGVPTATVVDEPNSLVPEISIPEEPSVRFEQLLKKLDSYAEKEN